MKPLTLTFTIALASSTTTLLAEQPVDYVPEARQQMMKLGKTLKGELETAMKNSGPVEAIGVCNLKAPVISEQVSSLAGWDVARTSLRLRNPDNSPDDWERMVLESFESRKASGEEPVKIDHAEIITAEGTRTFRYMKAIPTEAVCLNCHGDGSEIAAETRDKLKELYPEDQATGFKLGDIRGAFTLQKSL